MVQFSPKSKKIRRVSKLVSSLKNRFFRLLANYLHLYLVNLGQSCRMNMLNSKQLRGLDLLPTWMCQEKCSENSTTKTQPKESNSVYSARQRLEQMVTTTSQANRKSLQGDSSQTRERVLRERSKTKSIASSMTYSRKVLTSQDQSLQTLRRKMSSGLS